MAELLQELGVPLPSFSRNPTAAPRGKIVIGPADLRANGVRRILLVTSALHMPRALALFRATDLEVIPAPTDFEIHSSSNAHPLRWLPDAQALADGSRAFKEYLAGGWTGWANFKGSTAEM